MVIRSGSTPAYWVLLMVSGTPSYSPSRPGGPSPCSTSTATLRIRLPRSSGSPSSAAATISSNLAGSMSITSPLSGQVRLAPTAGSNLHVAGEGHGTARSSGTGSARAPASLAGPGQLIVRPLASAQRLPEDNPVARAVGRRAVRRGPVGDRDRRGAARLDRRDIERREAERGFRVAVRRPYGRLGLNYGPALDERVAGLDACDHDALMRAVQAPARRPVRVTAAAYGQVNSPVPSVELSGVAPLRAHRRRRQQGASRQYAADRERPFEMVLVPGQHQVNAVLIEQRQPLLPDSQVSAVEMRRGHRHLMHEDHDPVDVLVLARRCQLCIQPPALHPAAVAADIGIEAARAVARHVVPAQAAESAVLQADIIIIERNKSHGADRERIPVAAERRCSVARQVESGLVRQIALRSVARLVLVVARCGHPRPVPGGAGDVGEVGRPCLDWLIAVIGVTQVAVE